MSFAIESAVTGDATAIARIHISSLRAAYEGLISDQAAKLVLDARNVEWRAQSWQKWLERSQVSTLVARVEGAVVGFCTLQPIREESAAPTAEISAVYVLPSHWRRGIGRGLCTRLLAEADTRGLTEVVLWVLESNERARGFYASIGFKPDGGTRVFFEDQGGPLHELRYRRST